MPPAPDLHIQVFAGFDALPVPVRALFGNTLFDTEEWYRTCCRAGLPTGGQAMFVSISSGAEPVALFPMLEHRSQVRALTTHYTCLWSPLLAPGADARAAGRCFGQWCATRAITRLDALDLSQRAWAPLRAGIEDAGLTALAFNHFGNWRCALAGADWATYFAGRPGQTRETLRRRGKKLLADGATFRVIDDVVSLQDGIDAYEAVYAASWKLAEPFPKFNATLMQACAVAGWLRLSLLEHAGHVLAAQIWVVQGQSATVLKLAHDETYKSASPGTVLTGLTIQHLIEKDRVTELDFGRGDDDYKKAWTNTRLQRQGLILANRRRPAGMLAVAQHKFGALFRGFR